MRAARFGARDTILTGGLPTCITECAAPDDGGKR